MAKLNASTTMPRGRIAQQVGVKPAPEIKQIVKAQEIAKESVKQTQPKVDYERAWREAQRHFHKGKAGAYLQFMGGDTDPYVKAVYQYVKALSKAQRAGDISPSSSVLAKVKRDIARQQPKPDEIIIDGLGYSVRPAEQEKFIKDIQTMARPTIQETFIKPMQETTTEWEVQPAPTAREKFRREVEQKGYIKGALGFLGGEAEALEARGQTIAVRRYGGRYDPSMTGLVGGVVETAPYFVPYFGTGLLIGAGTEELATEAGRERIRDTQKAYEKMGWDPSLARTVAWGLPVAEVGLGAIGARTALKGIKTRADVKRAETSFIAEEIPLPKGSRVKVIAETKIGKKRIIGVSEQNIFRIGEDYTLGTSRGYLAEPARAGVRFPSGRIIKEYQVSPVVGINFGKRLGGTKAIFPEVKSGEFLISQPTKLGEGVLGRTAGRVYGESGYEPFKREIVGGFKTFEGSPFSIFRGGKPSRLRVSKEGISYVARKDIAGVLYKRPKVEESIFTPQPADLKLYKPTQTQLYKQTQAYKPSTPASLIEGSAVAQVSKLSEAAKAQTLSQIKTFPSVIPGITRTAALAKPKVTTKTRTYQPQTVIQTPTQISKQREDSIVGTISNLATSQETKQAFVPTVTVLQTTIPKQEQRYAPLQFATQFKPPVTTTLPALLFPAKPPVVPKRGVLPILFGMPSIALELPKEPKKANSWVPQVKSKKKWRTVGRRMDYNSALSRASRGADLSTARSMRVKPSSKPPQVTGIRGWSGRSYKFRRGKKPNVYVEKRRFAIDSRGERIGLSIEKLKKNMSWGLPMQQTKRKSKKKRRIKSQWLV